MSRQLSPIKEKSKVIYKLALYFLGKFSYNKGLSHVDRAGLSVVTKDLVSQGATEKDLELEVKRCKHLLSRCPKFLSKKWLYFVFFIETLLRDFLMSSNYMQESMPGVLYQIMTHA